MVEKNSKEDYNLLTQENEMKFEIQHPEQKAYGNIITSIHLHTAYGRFHAVRAKLTSCARGHVACQTKNVSNRLLTER